MKECDNFCYTICNHTDHKIIIFKAFHISNLNMNISKCLYTFQQQHSCFQFYQTSGTSQGSLGVQFTHQISRRSNIILNDVQRDDGAKTHFAEK